jgi:urease beta subunit
VRTDDGQVVVVRGTPDAEAAITSVDRTYTVGARYEFHPINEASPFEDNACTGTRQLAAPGVGTAGTGGLGRTTGMAVLTIAGAAVAVVLAAMTVRRMVKRRRRVGTSM